MLRRRDLRWSRLARRTAFRVWGRAAVALLLGVVAFGARAAGGAGGAAGGASPRPTTAFFYGPNVPAALFAHFDRVVVEPDHMTALPAPGTRGMPFAHVSLGEVSATRPYRKDIPPALVIGKNDVSGADLVDTSSAAYRTFAVERILEPLYQRGFRGFHLDALDSHRLVAKDAAKISAHVHGLTGIVTDFKKRHADAKVLLHGGLDLVPAVGALADGVIVESLFDTFEPATATYVPVAKTRSAALLARLTDLRAKYPFPISVIDYVSPADRVARRAAAKRIADLGLDPWIASPSLDDVGVGRVEIVSRRVLVVYRGNDHGYLGIHDSCVLVAPVLEWLGYAVDYHDVREPLPAYNLAGRYAGIVSFVPEGVPDGAAYRGWLLRQMANGTRIAFFYGFGFQADDGLLSKLGLAPAPLAAKSPVRIASSSPFVGFETLARARLRDLPPVRVDRADSRSVLRIEDADKSVWDGVVLAPWGGAAFSPYVIEEGLDGARKWILDPFRFLAEALDLPTIPLPDVTTESGRRIMTIHIDGDGFVSRAEMRGNPYTAAIILEQILKKYRVPHTVSVIEGEVGPTGKYPKDSPKVEAIARDIFKLPHVELASHTFSHPFFWEDAEAGKTEPHGIEPVYLPIPGYTSFDLEREIKGSVDYIHTRLAPPGKRVKVLLWTGSCSPSKAAVALTKSLGLLNVNGGGATRSRDTPSLTRGSAMGIPKGGGAYQVFAPIENENVYTNDFLGPFYGYRRVIETFQLNESPRRLSLMTLYYHFYSGAKEAALVALKDVYEWAMKQETTPLYLSEYAAKVLAFQEASVARRVDDGALVYGDLGDLRTLRVAASWGWPDLDASIGIAGVRDVPAGRYLHVSISAPQIVSRSTAKAPARPIVEHSNGQILSFTPTGERSARLRIRGHMPLSIAIGGTTRGCTLKTAFGSFNGVRTDGAVRFTLTKTDTEDATLDCQ